MENNGYGSNGLFGGKIIQIGRNADEECDECGRKPSDYPDWIPVSERLPNGEPIGEFLWQDEDKKIHLGFFDYGRKRFVSGNYWRRASEVEAWMPLPNLYEDE